MLAHPSALTVVPAAAPVAPVVSPLSTPSDIAAAFLLGYSGETRKAYARDLRAWSAHLAVVAVEPFEAQRVHVDLFTRQCEASGLAPATIARRLSAVAGFYAYAVSVGCITGSPVALVKRPRVSDESPNLGLDRAQLARLLDVAEASSPRDSALVCLLALNGLRVSEALSIDVGDLGEQRGHRTVKLTRKGGKTQTAPLAPRASAAVDALIADRDDVLAEWVAERNVGTPLFVTRSGRRMDRQTAWKVVRRLARDAGIGHAVSPHSCRHGFITAALDAGVSLRDVQDAAAHADPRTTRRYDHGRQSLDRHATYRVASFVAAA